MKRSILAAIIFYLILGVSVAGAIVTGSALVENQNNTQLICNGKTVGNIFFSSKEAEVGRSVNSDNLNQCYYGVDIAYLNLGDVSTGQNLGQNLTCHGVVVGSVAQGIEFQPGFFGPLIKRADGSEYPEDLGCNFMIFVH